MASEILRMLLDSSEGADMLTQILGRSRERKRQSLLKPTLGFGGIPKPTSGTGLGEDRPFGGALPMPGALEPTLGVAPAPTPTSSFEDLLQSLGSVGDYEYQEPSTSGQGYQPSQNYTFGENVIVGGGGVPVGGSSRGARSSGESVDISESPLISQDQYRDMLDYNRGLDNALHLPEGTAIN